MPDEAGHKRQRVSKACDSCRRKKVKVGYIEAIETRLHRMESLLGGLVHSNDPFAEAVLAELMQDDPRPSRKSGNAEFTWRNGSLSMHSDTGRSGSSGVQSPENVQAKDNSNIDDLNEVMGILSIDENKQVRYHGRSSGLYLLKNSERYKNGMLSLSDNSPEETLISTQNLESLKRPELTILPSQEISEHLLEIYFTHIHPLLPIIYKPIFFNRLKDQDNPPLLLLNAIYALAARHSDRPELRKNLQDSQTAGDEFFDRAKALLDNDYDKSHITTIQALIIMALRDVRTDNTTRSWIYIGMAARMAQDLGIHRNNEKWQPISLSHEEKEEQKRAFWSCFVVDRIASTHMGRPLGIDEKDVDATYPSEEEDDEYESLPFKMAHVTTSSTLLSSSPSTNSSIIGSPMSPASTLANKDAQNIAHSVSRFNRLIKLCEIMGRIIQNIYAIRCNIASANSTVISVLDSSLTSWFLNLPPHLQYHPSSNQPFDTTTLNLHALYYSTLILLHRPYANTNMISKNSSHNICTTAANAITEIADTMRRRKQLRHSPTTVIYCTFTAAVIHTCNAVQPDVSISQPARENLEKGLKILDALMAIWPLTYKYAVILTELANLRDIQLDVDMETKIDRPEDGSTQSQIFNPISSLNPAQTYERHPSVMGFGNPNTMSSQSSSSYNQPQNSQLQLHHDLQESAQMFNNPFGYRYITSSTTDQQNQHTIGGTDPYAAPGVVSTNNRIGNETISSLSSGFWLSSNTDLDERSSYFGSQQMQQSASPFSSPPTLHSQPQSLMQMPLLHDDGNDVNMFADNHTFVTMGVGNNRRGSTSPLAYY
ncbi:7561_t:CDS:2 [Cetraspora pellucida]|uniref:7561_t:CDS:1 n=1 Tax=Cetraspora pellucida TaxID=1433469 RepID=A0A9N9BDP9_9GLOM|nr:7561_t:CDS:2 [Cetraspora pellucida]